MSNESLGYEIIESTTPDGGVVLTLVVEGSSVARATADATVISDMGTVLGIGREDVVTELRKALLGVLKTQGQFVEVSNLKEDPASKLRFSGRFIYRLGDDVSTGIVWYNVNDSTTGPESVPAVVRNKMRHEVHRQLTDPGSTARALVDLDD